MNPISRAFRSRTRSLLWLAPAAAALAAGAEPLAAPIAGVATVRITASALEPAVVGADAGQHLVFQNDSASMARVELDLPRGAGLLCRSDREDALRGRKFVVAGGAALECEVPAARTRYRVYRTGERGGAPLESSGVVAPEGARR